MRTNLQPRPLGTTGLMVSAPGYGAAGIGGMADVRVSTSVLLNAALDDGLTVIDTAECYGESEELIGAAVGHRRGEFSIFSKFGHASGLPFPDWDPRLVRPSVERSLARLRTDRLDLLQIHTCSLAQLREGSLIAAMQAVRDAGLCRFIGYSGDGAAARWAIASGVFATIQLSISIADQEGVELAAEAQQRGMGVIVKRPMANGIWRSGSQPPESDNLRLYWQRLKTLDYPFLATPEAADTALRFTLSVPGVSTALVFTSTTQRWQENAVSARRGTLTPEAFEAIRARWRAVAAPDWVGQT